MLTKRIVTQFHAWIGIVEFWPLALGTLLSRYFEIVLPKIHFPFAKSFSFHHEQVWRCNEINNGHLDNLEGDLLAQLEHENQVSALALCPDNSQLVSGTRDGRVTLWCLESYSIIQELPAHKRQVNGVKFSSDAKRVVSCASDFYMKVIDLQTGTILFSKGK